MSKTKSVDIEKDWESQKYQRDDRVIYVVLFNTPGYMKPGDHVPGTVISAFEVVGLRIYRIELDIRWSTKQHPLYKGEKMVIGNVYSRFMRPLSK